MYTLCPHCSTCFRLTAEHLNAAAGNVRCGNCGAVFNALDNPAQEPEPQDELLALEEETSLLQDDDILLNDPWEIDTGGSETGVAGDAYPAADPALGEEDLFEGDLWELDTPDEIAKPAGEPDLYGEQDFPPLGEDAPVDASPAPETDNDPVSAAVPAITSLPEATEGELLESYLNNAEDITIEELEKLFLADEPEAPPPQQPIHPLVTTEHQPDTTERKSALSALLDNWIVMSAGSLLLILLLLGQYIWSARDYLAQHYPETRPLLSRMCEQLDCRLALRRDPSRLQITNRDVRTHPTAKEALLINATFVNRAPFRQPYPLIELKLSNLRGREIGRRTFLPREYLAGEPDIEAGIPPEGQVYLVLEVMDPGRQAVNFEFDFR